MKLIPDNFNNNSKFEVAFFLFSASLVATVFAILSEKILTYFGK